MNGIAAKVQLCLIMFTIYLSIAPALASERTLFEVNAPNANSTSSTMTGTIAGSASTWYDQSWKYRKAIEISNTGKDLFDYQIYFKVDTQSLISAGELNSDGSDLLFVDSNNTLLPFWNETEYNLINTTIWVKVPSIIGMTNKTIYMYYGNPAANSIADGDATFEFFENDFLTPLDNYDTYLFTPTYDGSGQAIHPDIYYNATGWNGYKYWMAMTPYPQGKAFYENPSILASNDGFSWVVPAGLINPIDPAPGDPRFTYRSQGSKVDINSDPDIVYNETSNTLEVYYVENFGGTAYLKQRTSVDGINWSVEKNITTGPWSPAIIKNGSIYDMWYDDATACDDQKTYVRYRTSPDGISWSSPQDVNINQPDINIWHVNVNYIPSKNEYMMVFAAYPKGSNCGDTTLYFAESTDKINWTTYDDKILGKGRIWDSAQIYRSTFLYDSATDVLRVWYSAKSVGGVDHSSADILSKRSNSGDSYSYNVLYKNELSTASTYLAALTLKNGATFSNIGVLNDVFTDISTVLNVWYSAKSAWHVGYTERRYHNFADGLRWSRSYNTGSSSTNPRDGVYGLRQAGAIGKSPVHKLAQRSNSSGSYSYNVWYKDELSKVPSYLAALNLNHGRTFSNIGVFTDVSRINYTLAISGSYADTGIERTAGWHRLEIRVNTSGMYFFVDGKKAGSTASVTSSAAVIPSINGYFAGTAYYDDYYIRKYSYPEPTYIFMEEESGAFSITDMMNFAQE